MIKFLQSSVAGLALVAALLASPALSQSESDTAVRMGQLEEQMRLLLGQVEELTFEVKQLKGQFDKVDAGAVERPAKSKKLSLGAEQVEQKALAPAELDQELVKTEIGADGTEQEVKVRKAPGPKILGSMNGTSTVEGDSSGFQGQVLVAPAQQEPGADAGLVQDGNQDDSAEGMKTVALASDTPDALYERSYENLFRRQFGDAEQGFRDFVQKYPDHSLTGAAQYWLGETFYAQQDYRQAAEAFLVGYKQYPKSRRAPDSLLKLGISLDRLGQKEQACAAYNSVTADYPKAVEARKRAQAAAKNAGCAS